MKTSANLLHDALAALSAHRVLIGEAYERGNIVRTAENAREVFVLLQLRILVTDGHDTFRLARTLTNFLNDLTQKQRLFELLGADIGKLNNRVHLLRNEYKTAVMDGRLDDIDNIAAEFHDACAELSDAVTSSISRLLLQAENNFGVVKALSAKERQNKHYLDEAETLARALGSLELMSMQDLLDTDAAAFAPLAMPYRRLITGRLPEWNTELNRVIGILKEHLYRLRQIAPDVRRLRDFARFLQQTPGYAPPDFVSLRHPPLWLLRDPGMVLVAHPDMADTGAGHELEAIARKLPAPKIAVKVVREAGVLSRRDNQQAPVTVTPPPWRMALQRLGHHALASATPVSALRWRREQATDLDLPEDVWLHLVLHTRQFDRAPFSRLTYQSIGRDGPSPISRNRVISDVLLNGR